MTERVDDDERPTASLVALRPTDGAPAASPQTPPGQGGAREPPFTAFDRRELSEILKVYGRMVAAGEWRDYAIDTLKDRAVFSIFRRTSEVPLYRIEKNPRLARRQGAYAVISQTGMILKRGPDLARVLKVLDKSLKLVDA
ncbi:DUF2794 domain-containing protein [Mongoliimonas terrestris]|uniref:DUF2794 domain-containing protein n=1 Tax=Mongoliimonas terrestris TaxID=1709001 RepID=UPI000A9223FF|nr:DUF2794 domain-containing protein [Mongoliimonas terrestris]